MTRKSHKRKFKGKRKRRTRKMRGGKGLPKKRKKTRNRRTRKKKGGMTLEEIEKRKTRKKRGGMPGRQGPQKKGQQPMIQKQIQKLPPRKPWNDPKYNCYKDSPANTKWLLKQEKRAAFLHELLKNQLKETTVISIGQVGAVKRKAAALLANGQYCRAIVMYTLLFAILNASFIGIDPQTQRNTTGAENPTMSIPMHR